MLRILRCVDAAFCLARSAPATGAHIFAGCGSARAGHTPDRCKSGCDQWMRRQMGALENGFDRVARDVGERIELQPAMVLLDDWDACADAALKSFASIDPGIERLQRIRQRLHLADEATGVGISEPEIALGVLAR